MCNPGPNRAIYSCHDPLCAQPRDLARTAAEAGAQNLVRVLAEQWRWERLREYSAAQLDRVADEANGSGGGVIHLLDHATRDRFRRRQRLENIAYLAGWHSGLFEQRQPLVAWPRRQARCDQPV